MPNQTLLMIPKSPASSNPYPLSNDLSGKTIVDIGSSMGYFAKDCVSSGVKQLFCFEPSKQKFDLLDKSLIGHREQASCYNAAIWRSDEQIATQLYLSNKKINNLGGEKVASYSLVHVLVNLVRNRVDILNFNCGSSVYPILFSVGHSLDSVDVITGQFVDVDAFRTTPDFAQVSYHRHTIDSLAGYLISYGFKTLWERIPDTNQGYFYSKRCG